MIKLLASSPLPSGRSLGNFTGIILPWPGPTGLSVFSPRHSFSPFSFSWRQTELQAFLLIYSWCLEWSSVIACFQLQVTEHPNANWLTQSGKAFSHLASRQDEPQALSNQQLKNVEVEALLSLFSAAIGIWFSWLWLNPFWVKRRW